MKLLKKIAKILAGVLVTILFGALAIYLATGPQQPASGTLSASWLEPGPYSVGSRDYSFVDASRPTSENRGVPGKPDRTLLTTLWFPTEAVESMPLVIHSHGIVSSRSELAYMAEALASHGYVVAAANYPLTSGATEGGANASDVVNQPADISFLIDSILTLQGADKPFLGELDRNRIGLSGYSLGGLTTYLTTYHPRWREPRVRAAVAIAGPSAMFDSSFFSSTSVPLLAIAGTADALIPFQQNVADIPRRVRNAAVMRIEGGAHLGFVGAAEPTFRFMENPDSLGCAAVLSALDQPLDSIYVTLGTRAEGIDTARDIPGVCESGQLLEATHPAHQIRITQLSALAFFESVFADSEARRAEARNLLENDIANSFEEASYIR